MPAHLTLDVTDSSSGQTRRVDVGSKGVHVGRAEAAGLRLADPEVSGLHCRVDSIDDHFVLIDESTNGTILNGRRLSKGASERIRDGDEIVVGSHRLRVGFGAAAAAIAQAPLDDPWALNAAGRGATLRPDPSRSASGWDISPIVEARTAVVPLSDGDLAALLLEGLLHLIAVRKRERCEARVQGQRPDFPDSHPLATARDATQARTALAGLAATGRSPAEAVRAAFAAVSAHDGAKLPALQHAMRHALTPLAPATLGATATNDALRWQAYERAFTKMGDLDGFAERLATAFAEGMGMPE